MSDDEITQKIIRHPVNAWCRKGHQWAAEYWDSVDPMTGKGCRSVRPAQCSICGLKYDGLDQRRNGAVKL